LGAIPAAERAPSGDDHQTLIFDWDGTLVDPRALNHRALEAAPRDCGVTLDPGWYWPRQAGARVAGNGRPQCADRGATAG
jgi:phosphoglycolate phosphatase-like HAD superfamily hydrolase